LFADALPLDLSARRPVSLAEVLVDAPQLTRVDRKYLLGKGTAQAFLDDLPAAYRVLSIAGRTSTSYRSTYFDTADLASARAHVQQRRRRWKARSRLYVEDALCRIEVKARDGRGVTAKMEVGYRRTTLAETADERCRVTVDWKVECSLDGERVWLDHDYVLVETKGGLRPSVADRLLTGMGVRPRSFSKYVAAASLIRDDLPDNDVRRLHGRELHLESA
jgi:hypothetical protein